MSKNLSEFLLWRIRKGSSLFPFIFFIFIHFSFPSGIPWADFDMGREEQDSPTLLVGEPASPTPSLHGGTTPGLIPVNTGIQ